MTLDELVRLFKAAKVATRPYVNGEHNGDRAGMRAVVKRLLEWQREPTTAAHAAFLHEILASDGEVKAAGVTDGNASPAAAPDFLDECEPGSFEVWLSLQRRKSHAAAPVCDVCRGTGKLYIRTTHDFTDAPEAQDCEECQSEAAR